MTSERARPRVLAVGPYELDHLLDQLFFRITEQYLGHADVVLATPFSTDIGPAGHVPAYRPLLENEEFDVVWTVGGGIGIADMEFAFRRAASPELLQRFERNSPDEQAQMINSAAGGAYMVHPYIPSPADYPRNAGAVSVINSVGLGAALPDPPRREALIALLRGITFLSVRDDESSELLASLGIEHRLVPDAFHAISLIRPPAEPGPSSAPPGSDLAVVYVLAATLAQLGPEPVAEALARSEYLRGMRLRVLQFSMAQDTYSEQNDQSRLLNQQLVAHLNRIVPSFDVQIDVVQHPFDVAERIRHARIVVGDEQHTRILAAAYDVPRLTLATPYSPKATRYHRTWDPRLPLEVPFDELDDAVAAALTAAADPSVVERARELSRLADDNLKDLAAQTTNAEAL